jgi:hypothetical protein
MTPAGASSDAARQIILRDDAYRRGCGERRLPRTGPMLSIG